MGTAWGIDVGRRAIKGVRMRDASGGPVIETADLVEVQLKANASEAEKDESMRLALSAFLKRHGIRGEPVFVSIPGHTTFNRVLRIPVVDEKKVESTIRFEAQQQIPFPIEEVIWDYHPLPSTTPTEREISLFAVKDEFIRKFLHNLELAGLHPAGIQIAPLALFNLVRYELDMRGANILLDMGSGASDLLVIDQDKTWMRTIPIAGNDVTAALEKKFHIPFEEAEKLKIKSGGSKQAQKIFGVMKPVLDDILSEIGRSLSYYRTQVPDVQFKECLILGSGGQIVGFRKFVKEALEVEATRLSSLKRIGVGPRVNVEFLQENLAGLPVAIGLALQAIGKADNQVNFLPRPLIERREVRAKRPWFGAAAAVLAIAAGVSAAGMAALRNEAKAALDSAKVADAFAAHEKDLAALKDLKAPAEWFARREALGAGRDAVARAWREALDALAPAGAPAERPSFRLIAVEIAPAKDAAPGAPLQVELIAALEMKAWEKMKAAVDALGAAPSAEALKEALKPFRREAEADVSSLVVGELKKRGRKSVEQTTGTFVDDLGPSVRLGTRFYRFKIVWEVTPEE